MNFSQTIIAVISGSGLTVLTSYFTTKMNNQTGLERLNLKLNNKEKREADKHKKKALAKIIKAKAKILKIMYKLKLNLSLTNNYILETINTSDKEIHEEYFKNHSLITDAMSICILNSFDEQLLTKLRKISGLANSIWGKRQNYFGHSKENEIAKNEIRVKLIEYFNLVSTEISEVEEYLYNYKYLKN